MTAAKISVTFEKQENITFGQAYQFWPILMNNQQFCYQLIYITTMVNRHIMARHGVYQTRFNFHSV